MGLKTKELHLYVCSVQYCLCVIYVKCDCDRKCIRSDCHIPTVVNTSHCGVYLCAKASAFCDGSGRLSELGVVSQMSSVPLMFSMGGVTGVKGDESSPPGDSCM